MKKNAEIIIIFKNLNVLISNNFTQYQNPRKKHLFPRQSRKLSLPVMKKVHFWVYDSKAMVRNSFRMTLESFDFNSSAFY